MCKKGKKIKMQRQDVKKYKKGGLFFRISIFHCSFAPHYQTKENTKYEKQTFQACSLSRRCGLVRSCRRMLKEA